MTTARIIQGDALEVLRGLESESVNCVVTITSGACSTSGNAIPGIALPSGLPLSGTLALSIVEILVYQVSLRSARLRSRGSIRPADVSKSRTASTLQSVERRCFLLFRFGVCLAVLDLWTDKCATVLRTIGLWSQAVRPLRTQTKASARSAAFFRVFESAFDIQGCPRHLLGPPNKLLVERLGARS